MSIITALNESEEVAQDLVGQHLDWYSGRSPDARRQRILKALDDRGTRSEVSDNLLAALQDPWSLLLYVLSSGLLGRKFSNDEIARMVHPTLDDVSGASQIIGATLSTTKRSASRA